MTATRSPVASREAAGADVATLSGGPIGNHAAGRGRRRDSLSAGAIVNTAGQQRRIVLRCSCAVAIPYNKVIVDGVTINEPGGTFDLEPCRWRKPTAWNFPRRAKHVVRNGCDDQRGAGLDANGSTAVRSYALARMAGTSEPRMAMLRWRAPVGASTTTFCGAVQHQRRRA